ncbi:MAG: CHAT domain-containing protein, partial [Thermodesulfobacteriota bacterium]
MNIELNLNFPSPTAITVSFDGDPVDFSFENPIPDEERDEILRYLENYPVQYMTDIDDGFARKLEERLPDIGARLFRAAFSDSVAKRLFDRFQDEEEPGRLITVSASHPDILSLPWELLRDPDSDVYLCNENPRISIRRRLSRAGGGRARKKAKPKDTLHLLFVVSRPDNAGFIDPRADPEAVMDALDAAAPGRVTTEFLRPATLEALVERLEDADLPSVDILHFDGHGAYDPDGRFSDEAQKDNAAIDELFANADLRARKEEIQAGNVGYLLFEKENGERNLVPAGKLGEMLNRQKVSLVVLSACQSAKMGGEDAMGSVAARLTHAGIPAVLAMTHSVLVATTKMLFGEFYKHLGKGKPVGESLDNARRFLQMRPERGERPRGRKMVTLELQDWFLPALYQAGADRPLLRKGEAAPAAPTESPEEAGRLPAQPESGFHGRTVELWMIERAFLAGTRRITVTGFGGQGKTALAAETGRWLVRSGMFRRCCFVSFAAFQGVDPVAFAVSSLSVALDRSLIDAAAAEDALAEVPTLVILDNLESLTDGEEDRQPPLLDAAARWSRAGESRVLITT